MKSLNEFIRNSTIWKDEIQIQDSLFHSMVLVIPEIHICQVSKESSNFL